MKRKRGGGVGTHFEHESDNHRMLVHVMLACNQLCWFFGEKIGSRTTCRLRLKHSTLELNQEEVTALAHHRPQVWAVEPLKVSPVLD